MHPRLSPALAPTLLAVLLPLSGCQTPKHSNVLVFGTNTRVGLSVGYDPKLQNGDILVGYDRQEAVWMPLLANSNDAGSAPAIPAKGTVQEHLFVGRDGATTDTYSVLASLGTEFESEAGTRGGDGEARLGAGGGLAQFFATGLAARTLAEQGGADLLSIPSESAAKAREAEARARLAEVQAASSAIGDQRQAVTKARATLLAYAGTLTDAQLQPLLTQAQVLQLIPSDAKLDTEDSRRAALRKYLNAGDGGEADAARLQALQQLAAQYSL
jgi:hypothetical protein